MEIKELNNENLFYCYSINLFHYMKINGFRYLVKGVNNNTNKYYWVYERTPEFLKALTFFSNNKVKK